MLCLGCPTEEVEAEGNDGGNFDDENCTRSSRCERSPGKTSDVAQTFGMV